MTLGGGAARAVSKAAAVALLMAVVGLGAVVVVMPLLTRLADAREQIDQERLLLGRLLDEARTLTSQTTATDVSADEAIFLAGASDAERLASLQARVEAVAGEAQVQLKSLQPTGTQTQGPLEIVGMRVVAGGTIETLQAFLHGLEAGRPGLLVASLDVAPPAQDREATGELDMRLSISGAVPSGGGPRP